MVKRTRSIADGKKEPVKKPRHTINTEKVKLSSDDVLSLLKTHDASALRQGLITLKNQFTFNAGDPIPEPQDERLIIARSWLDKSPNAEGLFHILRSSEKNPSVIQLCFAILANMLDLLSTHFIYHPYGAAILKALLSQPNLDILNLHISEGSQDVILSALNLLIAMSSFAGGVEKRAVMDGFTWGQKTRQKLFFLRRKTRNLAAKELMGKPDIRTLYINFILSFLTKSTTTTIKVAFLEQHKDTFLSIFKGIDQDPWHVIRQVLETCWEGIWNDNKLKRTVKVSLFQERTLRHLLKLYDRKDAEDDNEAHVPADIVHHFLLAIMTRRGFGICFSDRGWYPRNENESMPYNIDQQEDDPPERSGGKIYNIILSNILKLLKVNEDARQQELTFKILQACPELVSGYWTNISLTLEPRLSSRWITNISVLGTIISSPIPVESFALKDSAFIHPIAPPLRSCMSNILPAVLNRAHLTKGLQSTSTLVKHCTALTLTKCLMKLNRVISIFRKNSSALEENQTSGQWVQRARDLQREVERQVPDVMVIIGMAQQNQRTNNTSSLLLGECALRLLGLYQTLFPRLFSEVKFDTGKLLESVLEPPQTINSNHHILYRLHILRFLMDNDHFSGMNKMGPFHSQLYGILLLHAKSENLVIRDIAAALSNKALSSSILFMHDPIELDLWLQAFPRTRRSGNARTQDEIPLSDEVIAVLGFLDDCIQRCSKTPYKYLEELRTVFEKEDADDLRSPSPLLITVLGQFEAKVVGKLLSPSDTLALTTFVRKLGVALSTKFSSLNDTRIIQQKLVDLVSKSIVISDSAIFQAALQQECTLFLNIIDFIEKPFFRPSRAKESIAKHDPSQSVISTCSDACYRAYELLDSLRFNISTLSNEEIKRLFETVLALYPPACVELCYYIDPTSGAFKECINRSRSISNMLPFELCNIHLSVDDWLSEDIARLCVCFYSGHSWNKSFTRRLAITLNRLKISGSDCRLSRVALLNFIKKIIAYGIERNILDISTVSEAMFGESDAMRDICCSSSLTKTETQALHDLVQVVIDPLNKESREAINSYCIFWADLIKNTNDLSFCRKASPWIPYMEPSLVVRFLDLVLRSKENDVGHYVVTSALLSIARQLDSRYVAELQSRIEGLLSLSSPSTKNTIDHLILAVLETTLPIGYNGPMAYSSSNFLHTVTLATLTDKSKTKWLKRSEVKGKSQSLPFQFSPLLEDVDRNGIIISVCFYRYENTRSLFQNWLRHNTPPMLLSQGHIFCLYGFLDSALHHERLDVESFRPWSRSLIEFVFHRSSSHRLRAFCAESIKILCRNSAYRTFYATWLSEKARFMEYDSLNPEIIQLITELETFGEAVIAKSLGQVFESILDWIAKQLAKEEIPKTTGDNISLLVSTLKGHKFKEFQVETSIKSAIRNHLNVPSVLDISTVLIQSVNLKPMTINQLLQSIVQHERLYLVPDNGPLTKLLYTLFHTHPTNTCQPSHVTPLLRLYQGTMSVSDRRLLSIFQLYERQTRQSIASLFNHWSSSQISTPSQNTLAAIATLDSSKVFRTCFSYPKTRCLYGQLPEDLLSDQELYDPLFLMSMGSQVILAKDHISVPDWVQIFRTNIFSVVVTALSSKDNNMRQMSSAILGGLHHRLQDTEMIEKDQVLYILGILKNTLPVEDLRLPTFVAIFLAHAMRCIFYPSSFLYPVISRFLLQRPEFDITDVPLLYSLLFSIVDVEWAKERTWIVRYLTQIMDDGDLADWKILRRRHTWDLIASMWQASKKEDRVLRRGILELMATLTANQYALPSLVLRSQVLCWLGMQLTSSPSANELLAWLRIIENIVVFMDFEKAEKALKGTYSDSIIRCLKHIANILSEPDVIASSDTSLKLDLIFLASRILLRISEMESAHPDGLHIMEVAENLSKILFGLESSLQLSEDNAPPDGHVFHEHSLMLPPHKAHDLFAVSNFIEDGSSVNKYNCKSWASIVTLLWRVTMSSAYSRHSLWDHLTHRCLMIHSLGIIAPGSSESTVSSWVRRRALECVCHDTVED